MADLLECVAWRRERGEVARSLGESSEEELTPEKLVPVMLRSTDGLESGICVLLHRDAEEDGDQSMRDKRRAKRRTTIPK